MPTIVDSDLFEHNNFTVPGGGPYSAVAGTPAQGSANPQALDVNYLICSDAAVSEYVEYQFSPTLTLGWNGFFFRINTGEEPAGNTTIWQMWTTGFGQAAKLYWVPATNELSITVADVAYTNAVITLDAWHWLEMIFDVGSATHSVYWRIDDVLKTTQADSGGGAASNVQFVDIGEFFGGTGTFRYSHYLRGNASSTSDWLGTPGGGAVGGGQRMLMLGVG